ncbi:MAG: hypothetical protein DDT19_00259 [Syntrophomonadaceae bacterium]|nr:hypothetical protein [Bacillota bacterium]
MSDQRKPLFEIQDHLRDLEIKLTQADRNNNSNEWIHIAGQINSLLWVLGRLD